MKIKINWGIGLAVFYIAFVLILVVFVIFSSVQNSDLVSTDYYSKEINYQQQIDKLKRTKRLPEKLNIVQNSGILIVKFPSIFKNAKIMGNIDLYRPSNPAYDKKVKIEVKDNNFQVIDARNMVKGYWKIKVDWSAFDSTYYSEEAIILE